MKLYCNISGLTIELNNQFTYIKNRYDYIHPIFTLDKKELIGIYNKGLYLLKNDDIRLLTTALLYSTDLVRFDYNINMDMDIKPLLIALPRLIEFIDIMDYVNSNIFIKVVINKDNNKLKDLNNWLDIWFSTYSDYCMENRVAREIKSDLIESYHNILDGISREAYKKPSKYHKALARYIVTCIDDNSLNKVITVKNSYAYKNYLIELGNKKSKSNTPAKGDMTKLNLDAQDNNPSKDINHKVKDYNNSKILLKDYYIYIIEYCGNLNLEDYKYIIDIPSKYYPEESYINKLMDLIRITFVERENIHYYRVMELLDNMVNDTKILSNLGKLTYNGYFDFVGIGDYHKDTKPIIERLTEEFNMVNVLDVNATSLDKLRYKAKLQQYINDNQFKRA